MSGVITVNRGPTSIGNYSKFHFHITFVLISTCNVMGIDINPD